MGRQKLRDPIDSNYELFGKRLAELRKLKQLSQAELAHNLEIAPSSIAEYETGTTRIQLTTIKRISEYFEVSVDYLIGIDNSTDPLLIEINHATPGEKERILEYAKFILSNRET